MKKLLMMLLVISAIFIVSCGGSNNVVECNNVCKDTENGATQCTTDNKDFETCTLQDNGCYEWVKTDCTGNKVCVVDPNTKVAGCGLLSNPECTDNTDCSGDTPVCDAGNCVADTTNPECTDNTGCSGDTPVCDAGNCVAGITNPDPCAVDGCNDSGTTECDTVDSNILKTCTLQAEGCLKWEETDCSDNALTCLDTTGTAACGVSVK